MSSHKVFFEHSTDLAATVERVFKFLGRVDLTGKNVLVKPNMLRPALADECVVTDPRLISATVTYLMSAKANVVVGDNPAPGSSAMTEKEVAERCGFVAASAHRWRSIGRYSRRIRKPANLLKEFHVSREVLDCDLLVSLPKYKSHALTLLSIAVKNSYGIIPGGFKARIHAQFPRIDDFSRVLVEIYETRRPDVIIVDALNVVDARGRRSHPGVIIAGDNGHAVDYVCAQMAGIDPFVIPTLKHARDTGLFDPDRIEVEGPLERIRRFHLPVSFPLRNSIVEFGARVLYRIWLKRVPVIDPALCTRCLSCENVCPPRAIKVHNIDYHECIKCYCCLEVCPSQAVRIRMKLV